MSNPTSDFIAPVGRLLTEQREGQVFWELRLRSARGSLARMFTTSRLRMSLVVFLSLFFWVGLFVLFYEGFNFLDKLLVEAEIVQSLYNAFFLALMVMLVFSSGIILYSTLYCSHEAAFLLTTPARTDRIFAHKFQEAVWFSSWGFVLLGSPMLVAYGVIAEAPWYYYALLLPFVIAFVYIPAAIGGMLCLLVVHWLPSIRLHTLAFAGLLTVGVMAYLGWQLFSSAESDLMTANWFNGLLMRLRVMEQRLLPSWWLSAGLLEATRPAATVYRGEPPWAQSLLFLALLVANAFFFSMLAIRLARKVYRPSYSRLFGEVTARRGVSEWWLDGALAHGATFLPRDVRLLLVKDFRLFRRDPVQWSQFIIFFGLLALYFLNIRRFSYSNQYSAMISFLNLAVVGLILSTFTTRFVFPMISLEGRRLWILGLLPIRRDSILWAKYLFAAVGSLFPCAVLILLSDLMLQVSTLIVVVHQLDCLMLCLGLSAIAVGFGAMMPDLREHSPSKIAAGFGGTLNLVVSAAFIVLVVLLTAVPVHLYLATQPGPTNAPADGLMRIVGSPLGVAAGILLTLIAGTLATVWPLRAGLKAFRNLEM